jgi:hypothetical protein
MIPFLRLVPLFCLLVGVAVALPAACAADPYLTAQEACVSAAPPTVAGRVQAEACIRAVQLDAGRIDAPKAIVVYSGDAKAALAAAAVAQVRANQAAAVPRSLVDAGPTALEKAITAPLRALATSDAGKDGAH